MTDPATMKALAERLYRNAGAEHIAGTPKTFRVRLLDEAATALDTAAAEIERLRGGPSYAVNCCNCGRIVDTREKDEGGDGFGAELSDERWVCSPDCWDAVVEPHFEAARIRSAIQGGENAE